MEKQGLFHHDDVILTTNSRCPQRDVFEKISVKNYYNENLFYYIDRTLGYDKKSKFLIIGLFFDFLSRLITYERKGGLKLG